jgi:hypothetical protein
MRIFFVFVLACMVLCRPASAAEFESHQQYLDGLKGNPALDLGNPADVLEYVLAKLPETIVVKPTENYSYFTFVKDGVVYQGNLRLETDGKQAKTLHFAYFVQPQGWHSEDLGQYKAFGAADGVTVSAETTLRYRVAFRGRTHLIQLNDIGRTEIPEQLLKPGEVYLGQANDESGLAFFLIFDAEAKAFLYVLDETSGLLDKLVPFRGEEGPPLDRMSVGLRTGFVFLAEPSRQRRRLAGVYEDNISHNTYLDGPFDQLPDAYRGKLNVKQAFAIIDPEIANTIYEFGNFTDRDGARIVIAPYLRYWSEKSFEGLRGCLKHDEAGAEYRKCVANEVEK